MSLALLVANMTQSQLTPFEVGQIKAHMEHGLGCPAICKRVFKAGTGKKKETFGETAIQNAMKKLRENPGWRGEREEGSGAPRKTTPKQDREVYKWVMANRGARKVSVTSIKREFPYMRQLSDTLVEERLHEFDLEYLRRRKKTMITKEYLAPRVEYCQGVKRKHDSTLQKWAYTDGTVYYMDRDDVEHESTKRRALGLFVWRKSDNSDAMYEACIGHSGYNKGQGTPVRVWGMLAAGVIHIHVLDEDEVMDTTLYVELIEDQFEEWRADCEYLVCDFEGCIRSQPARWALDKIGLKLVEGYPVNSQDFNAMENAWSILKERLDKTVPRDLETRDEFVRRLKAAVSWANQHRSEQLWYLSTNQKERAQACLDNSPPGGRTKW